MTTKDRGRKSEELLRYLKTAQLDLRRQRAALRRIAKNACLAICTFCSCPAHEAEIRKIAQQALKPVRRRSQ